MSKNKELIKRDHKKYYDSHKDIIRAKKKVYREKHKEERLAYNRDYYKNKIKLEGRVKIRLRIRLREAIRNNQKAGSAVKDLGCSIQELKVHLEGKFEEGMNWNNWGRNGWHIDHIKPLNSFNLEDKEELLRAVNYKNLQPMWAEDNLRKSSS